MKFGPVDNLIFELTPATLAANAHAHIYGDPHDTLEWPFEDNGVAPSGKRLTNFRMFVLK
tara:strand:+ start:800 stop:979 length:180 start_codon:yes stop_codon:yes gene_type:complete